MVFYGLTEKKTKNLIMFAKRNQLYLDCATEAISLYFSLFRNNQIIIIISEQTFGNTVCCNIWLNITVTAQRDNMVLDLSSCSRMDVWASLAHPASVCVSCVIELMEGLGPGNGAPPPAACADNLINVSLLTQSSPPSHCHCRLLERLATGPWYHS